MNDGGPAFPGEYNVTVPGRETFGGAEVSVRKSSGMTLRDYFAAATLQGLLAAGDAGIDDKALQPKVDVAEICYVVADAMIEARK